MNVGIIGCGAIAAHHLHHLLRRSAVQRICLADHRREQAQALGSRFGLTHLYPDFDAMAAAEPCDAVHVLTPPMTHAELAIRAMETGAHVLVEKPMALSERDAASMLAASQRHNVRLAAMHNLLFDPMVVRARRIVDSGRLGQIVHVDCTHVFDLDRAGADHTHWSLALPGGPVVDHLPHPISLLLHFMGRPDRVHAVAKRRGLLPADLPDEVRVLCDGGNVTGLLSVSFGIRPDSLSLSIYGTEMSLHANISNMALIVRKNRHGSRKLLRVLDNVSQASQLLWATASGACKIAVGRSRPPGDVGPVIRGFYDSIERGEAGASTHESAPFDADFGRDIARVLDRIREQMK